MYLSFYKGKIEPAFNPIPFVETSNLKSWLYLITSSTKLVCSLFVFLTLLGIFVFQLRKEFSRSL